MDYNPPGEMECGERKRRRKSRSFKLVTDEDHDPSNMMNSSGKDVTGEPKVAAAVSDVWLADEGVEIKRQITGMMRLLRDKSSRVYQRTEAEQDCVTEEPQDGCQDSEHKTAPLCLGSDDHQSNSWDCAGDIEASPSSGSTTVSKGPGCGQYSTHSKALRIQNNKYLLNILKVNEAKDAVPPAVPETPCCMCNCKGTLQAILQELRTVRRMMHAQKASVERQEQAASPCQPRLGPGPAPCCRPRKWRPFYKVAPLSVSSTRRAAVSPLEASPLISAPAGTGNREECEKEQCSTSATNHPIPTEVSVPPLQNNSMTLNHSQSPPLNQLREPQSLEVRLAKDYDVFISKPQLDSILINYTRSGSLLFRKLVCAFFDDTTLANSLPNGKRKRGLNDHRKGLDQNIVGAIKVFTEKYCTEHRIEKLPGPRDWVQILQDQIKLARRRLKRDAVDAEEALNAPSTSCDYTKPTTVKGMAVNTT